MDNVFKCLIICGKECCTFNNIEDAPLVFPWEKRLLERLAAKKGVGSLEFRPYAGYVSGGKAYVLLYKWVIRGKCPFLDGYKCLIHEEKPLACKMYPLIIGWGDNTLRVSGSCPWVRENIEFIRTNDPRRVFPEELPHALKAFAILTSMDAAAKNKGWMKRVGGELADYEELIDIDEAIEIK